MRALRSTRRAWTIDGDSPIRVERDRNGLPHVRAHTEADLYRGLGSCHGVDRALQLLLVRIFGQGRASELLSGDDRMLELDRMFRRHGFTDAGGELAKLDDDERALLDAYCDGVNRALRRRVPWELRALRYRPEPWRPADCILVACVAGYVSLAQSQEEVERLIVEMVQAGVPRGHLEALFPNLLGALDEKLVRSVKIGERVVPAALAWAVPAAIASNNWVIAPSRTASGGALLANDPHLECTRLPAVWYEVTLELGERWCIAATMPGIPAPVIGRTNDLAWGATYTFMDTIDSWVEECRDGRYRRVVEGREQWLEFRERTETIRRKRGASVVLTIHENDHGVLDGDPNEPGRYLATRWSGARSGGNSLRAMMRMLHVRDADEGRAVLGQVETAWNWTLADRGGSIAYQMSGLMPLRSDGVSGIVPLPGWDPTNDWRGFAAPGDLPRALDPEDGFLVTANDDLNHLGAVSPINMPMGDYRARRIRDSLVERRGWTAEDCQRLQMDTISLQARELMEFLVPLLPEGELADVLRAWDFSYGVESMGAPLFEAVYRQLVADLTGRATGPRVVEHLLDETGIITDFYAFIDRLLLDADSVWWQPEGRERLARRAIERALGEGMPEPWGRRNKLVMRHLLLGGRLPRVAGFDRGPFELRGGRATVHQAQLYRSGGRDTSFAPSLRFVTDLSTDTAWTALAGGPSDRRFSRWYASGVKDWLAGRFKRVDPVTTVAGKDRAPRSTIATTRT